MAAWASCDAITQFCDGRVLKVVIFEAAAAKELARLERQVSKSSWPRFEALAQRLADYGQIHNKTAFKHEFDGIYAIKAKRIRAFGVFEGRRGGQRYFVVFCALKKNKGRLSKHEVANITKRRSMFDEWRRQQDE